jgi:hypothetical protein
MYFLPIISSFGIFFIFYFLNKKYNLNIATKLAVTFLLTLFSCFLQYSALFSGWYEDLSSRNSFILFFIFFFILFIIPYLISFFLNKMFLKDTKNHNDY